jgi:integrase
MPVVNMTDRFVKTLKPGAQAVEWFDEDTWGLSLKINPGGSVTWYYNYTRRSDGVRRRVQLGKVEALSVKDARLKARRTMGLVADGKDPAADRQAMTVGELAEKYLTLYAEKEKRTGRQDRLAIAKDVLPIMGRLKAEAATRRDIGRITERMVGRGVTVGASRTFAIVSKMFNWAVAEGLLEHTPCAGMRKPFKTGERERVLCDGELRAVWNGLPKAKISKDGQAVLKLCLITSQRLGEVTGMSKDEFNLETCVWTIPSDRFSPGGRAAGFQGGLDRVPFPGYGKDDAPRSSSVGKAVRRSRDAIGIAHWTAHDLRQTAATYMADLGVPPHVIAHALNRASLGLQWPPASMHNGFESHEPSNHIG